jgi:hypothetical protein
MIFVTLLHIVLCSLMIACAWEGVDVALEIASSNIVVDSLNSSMIQQEAGLSFLKMDPVVEAFNISVSKCKPGFFCPFNSTSQIPCPQGTYNPNEGQYVCAKCPLGTYSYKNETMRTSCVQCPQGSYTLSTASQRADQCLMCPQGYSCAAGILKACPVGTYNPNISRSECIACPLGTYSNDEHRLSICPPCPANSVCLSPSQRMECPLYTTSAQSSAFIWDCKCLPGYECAYRRQAMVRFSFNSTQNMTLSENNTALIEGLRQSVARASGVELSKVSFKGFV